jgi:hypothetical protein
MHFAKEPRGLQENMLALLCAGIANPHYNTLSLEYTFDTLIKWVSGSLLCSTRIQQIDSGPPLK